MPGSNVVITVVTVVVLVAVVAWIALSSAGNDADGNPHTQIFIAGTVSFDDDREDVGVQAHLNKNGGHDGATPTWRIAMSDSAGTQLTDFNIGSGFTFDFNADGALTACDALGDDAGASAALEALDEAIESGGDVAAALGVTVTGSIGDGYTASHNGKTFTTTSITLEDTGNGMQGTPGADECAALNADPVGVPGVQNGDCGSEGAAACEDVGEPLDFGGEGRRLDQHGRTLWGGTASAIDLWWIARNGYQNPSQPNKDANAAWTKWDKCEGGNAFARFIYKYPVMTISIAGTDGLPTNANAIGDWIDNLNTGTSGNNHAGFMNYKNKISSCLDSKKALLAGWGIGIDYIVGHSLGGAAATVYAQHHGEPNQKVVTFGSPPSRTGSSCNINGDRYAHQNDAIASNVMGFMNGINHDISSSTQVYDYSYCSSDCWAGCCPWGWSWDEGQRGQGCTAKSGGCSFLLDCAYYFGTVHRSYEKYL